LLCFVCQNKVSNAFKLTLLSVEKLYENHW